MPVAQPRELAAGAIAGGPTVVLACGVLTDGVDPVSFAVGLLVLLSDLVGVVANRYGDRTH